MSDRTNLSNWKLRETLWPRMTKLPPGYLCLSPSVDFGYSIAMQSLLASPPKLLAQFSETKGTMAAPPLLREVFCPVCSVLGLRCDWIKPWILDFRQTRRLTQLFFYAAGLRSDYWSTTGTGNSPFWQLPTEERWRSKLLVLYLDLNILFSVNLRGLNSASAFKSWLTKRMTKNLARNKYRNYLSLICLVNF